MKNVALHNLGCKVNSYELDVIQQMLQEKGYNIVPFDQEADIYIVNTCTVTNIADKKSRQMLHRARTRNPEAVVVAVGCYVQAAGEKAAMDQCIDLAIGNNRKKDLVRILEDFLEHKKEKCRREDVIVDISGPCEYEEMSLQHILGHTRAYIKIQDGCNQFCTFCIIPYARGRVRSRKVPDVLAEVRRLAAAGYQEIVLTGIHISSYGAGDNGGSDLIGLVERIHQVEGICRIRLGSLEPRIITGENVKRLAALEKVCPHFHLSLQSGCDATLKRMNRRYTTGEYYQSVEMLRASYGQPAITTDVIVGFPGETDEEYGETKSFLQKLALFEMHIFKYSRRQGTAADKMPDQVPEAVKSARSGELFALEEAMSRNFRSSYIGRKTEVLFEDKKLIGGSEYQLGHTMDYVKAALKSDKNLSNCIKDVKVTGFLNKEVLICISLD